MIRKGHPWVFSDSIRDINRPGEAGEMAVIFDKKKQFLAIGLYDPDSPIRLRILHHGKATPIDDDWFRARLQRAVSLRKELFDPAITNGYRVIHGESDGWPGLVMDRYGTTYVMKIYSLAWLPRLDLLVNLVRETLAPERIVLRLSRNIQEAVSKKFGKADGDILYGPPVRETPTFLENGILFEADVLRGQKTGFFLDQRENRLRIGKLAQDRRVLNAFSFSGGFSLYAARGNARSVTDLDISAHALESAERNFRLNDQSIPALSNCPHQPIQADVFQWLRQKPDREFDLIVLDPPSLARRQTERTGAINAYHRLVTDALAWLACDGIILAGSCSAQVSAEDFFATVRSAMQQSGRRFVEIETTQHAPDHPANFHEANYLKGIYLKVLDHT